MASPNNVCSCGAISTEKCEIKGCKNYYCDKCKVILSYLVYDHHNTQEPILYKCCKFHCSTCLDMDDVNVITSKCKHKICSYCSKNDDDKICASCRIQYCYTCLMNGKNYTECLEKCSECGNLFCDSHISRFGNDRKDNIKYVCIEGINIECTKCDSKSYIKCIICKSYYCSKCIVQHLFEEHGIN